MKCPYCSVNYMDDERVCPVCGKRAGPFSQKKKSKFSQVPYPPKETRRTAGSAYTSRKTDRSASTRQRPVSPPDNPYIPQPQRRSGRSSGCASGFVILVLLIVVVLVALPIGAFQNLRSVTSPLIDPQFLHEEYNTIPYESYDVTDILTGTWIMSGTRISITIHDDNTISWSDGTTRTEDPAPRCRHILLDEDNIDDYDPFAANSRFPIDSYAQYNLYIQDPSETLDVLDLILYYPLNETAETITELECYNITTGTQHTFTRADTDGNGTI